MNNSRYITIKNKTYWKDDFIKAYMWSFGETQKKANEVWKICIKKSDYGYIVNTVEDYKHQCRLAFYYD